MAYTWQQFIAGVITQLTDKEPDDAAFTEAQAEYVKARMASEIAYKADLYAVHQNRYTSLRRKLVGYTTTLNAAAQQVAVRKLVSDVVPDNTLFALACAYWIKGHLTAEINRDNGEGNAWMARYRETRAKLLGFTHTYADLAALQDAVRPFLLVDGVADNGPDFLTAQLRAAVSDLQGLAMWYNTTVAAAASDLTAMRPKVLKEIRAAVIDLQNYVEALRTGHVSYLDENDVTVFNDASRGTMPEQGKLREVWITYPSEDDPAATCRRCEAVQVPWAERFERLLCREVSVAQIAIDPYGREFLLTPRLELETIEAELVWDGVRADFDDGDPVPFDEPVMVAVAAYVNGKMALELGDALNVAREFERHYLDRRTLLYLDARDRAEANRTKAAGWPCCAGIVEDDETAETTLMTGTEQLTLSAAATFELLIQPKIALYSLTAEYLAGSGAYTHTIRLMHRWRLNGNRLEVLIGLPASVNPTVRIVDESGTEFIEFTHDGVPGWFRADFTFETDAWVLTGGLTRVGS